MLPNQSYTPEDILRIAWRRKWLILLPWMTITAAALLVVSRIPDVYRSETVIRVVPQRVPESYVQSTVVARIEDRLSTLEQQIRSRARLEGIIRKFDLYPERRRLMPMEDVVAAMQPDIAVTIQGGDAFSVGFVHAEPRLAQRVAEELASMFIDENLRDREALAEGTNVFLDRQLEHARLELLETERKVAEYRQRYNGELPSQVETNLRVIQTAQMQIQVLTEATNRDQERRLVYERQLVELEKAPPTSLLAAQTAAFGAEALPVGSTAQQLEAAIAQLQALQQQRFRDDHPSVRRARRQIADLEAALGAELAASPDEPGAPPITPAEATRQAQIRAIRADIEQLDIQIRARDADERRLRAVIEDYQGRVDRAPIRDSELIELTRDYDTLKSAYDALVAKRRASGISAELEAFNASEQFRVIDPANVPESPYSPNRLRLNVLGSTAGLAIGLMLVGLLEYRDRSLKTSAEVMRVLQLPVLAMIPTMPSRRERLVRRRRKLAAIVGGALLVASSASAYVAWTLDVF